jgi:predicted CoA-binding protein
MAKVTKAIIDNFLAAKRIAVIGVSRNPKDYSRSLFRELVKHGYEVIPVNPNIETMDGKPCFKSLRDIQPVPERVLIILPEDKTEQAVLECAEVGVKDIWLHRQVGSGVSDTRAIFRAEEKGLNLITGYCMFMFLPQSSFFHKLHGGIQKFMGTYPK